MNDDTIADLKQFIAATVTQAVAPLSADLSILKGDMVIVKQELRDVNLRLDTIADALAEQLDDHEQRLVRLEHRPA